MNPLARGEQEGVALYGVGAETIAVDSERRRFHNLNPIAATVLRHCDGQRGLHELASVLIGELHISADEASVTMVLRRLHKAHLLKECPELPDPGFLARRRLLRRLAALGGAALVSTVVIPNAEAAASCTVNSAGCIANGQTCPTTGFCCSCKCNAMNNKCTA